MTIPVLDGHNDALTAEWHDALTVRRTPASRIRGRSM
jgi:hypothetical protein